MAKKSVEERLQCLEDILEIHKLMAKYAYLVMAGMSVEIGKTLFAHRADSRVYLGEQGYLEGPDAWQRVEDARTPETEEERRARRVGMMAIHCPICPVVEVAEDGKTAKGVWIGLGLLAMKNRKNGEPQGAWEWDKYGIDFIKENGQWKIWHHHIYRLLHGWGVDEKWAEQFSKPDIDLGIKMDGPPVDDNPYRPDTVQRLVPKPPEHYKTWADTSSY